MWFSDALTHYKIIYIQLLTHSAPFCNGQRDLECMVDEDLPAFSGFGPDSKPKRYSDRGDVGPLDPGIIEAQACPYGAGQSRYSYATHGLGSIQKIRG